MSIQAPPNLSPGALDGLVRGGINLWGGVSPVTADHVNPEAPWPHLLELEQQTENAGRRRSPSRLSCPGTSANLRDGWQIRSALRCFAPRMQTALRAQADGMPALELHHRRMTSA